MIYTMEYESPVGRLFIGEKNGALTGLWIEGQKYFLGAHKNEQMEEGQTPILIQTKKWLDSYFGGEKPSITQLKLSPEGSEFRREIWKILCEIPYGKVVTYGEISRKYAASQGLSTMSAQAVGGAVGHNPISIIIPCHRVVGTGGSLPGYAGGIDKKIQLLTHEGVNMEGLFMPKG